MDCLSQFSNRAVIVLLSIALDKDVSPEEFGVVTLIGKLIPRSANVLASIHLRAGLESSGRAHLVVSGGRTPLQFFARLARSDA